jgi:hypothetical protein
VVTPNYIVGKAVAVEVGGEYIPATVTNANSGGYQQYKAGIKGASGSIAMVYNGDSPPTIVEGMELYVVCDVVGNETPFENPTEGPPTGLQVAMNVLVTAVKASWQVDADFNYSFDYMSSGPYAISIVAAA